jgi:hypothetical protein
VAIVGGLASTLLVTGAAQAKAPEAPQASPAPETFAPHDHADHDHAGHHHIGGHGPDPAPRGVDVRRVPTTEELVAAETSSSGTTSTTSGSVPCFGDGVSGQRVQAIYAVPTDRGDRYDTVAPLIRGYAAKVDDVFNNSAAETGGVRHVRWVTEGACQLSVAHAVVSSTADDTFAALVSAIKSQGFNRSDRKYLIWADTGVYCGVADMKTDDRAGATNANNTGAMYARVDASCWGQTSSVEAHELMHTMGGVQASAPHASAAGHCTDENDRMCYADGSGVTLSYVCPVAHDELFDCNHDDYFHTAPAAGTYLASHWNAAMNTFLEQVGPGEATPPASDPAPTAPSTTTETFSGATSRKAPVVRTTVTVGAGPLTANLSFAAKSTLTLTLRDANGAALAQASGKGSTSVTKDVAAGSYVLEVSGSGAVSYTLQVTHTVA